MSTKKYDSEFLEELADSLETSYYYNGSYYDYNDMDVRNLVNPIFEKLK